MSELINPLTDRTFQAEADDDERLVHVDALMDWTADRKVQRICRKYLALTDDAYRQFVVVLVDTKERLAKKKPGGLSLAGLRKMVAELLDNGIARKRIARNIAKREGFRGADGWRRVNEQLVEYRDGIRAVLLEEADDERPGGNPDLDRLRLAPGDAEALEAGVAPAEADPQDRAG